MSKHMRQPLRVVTSPRIRIEGFGDAVSDLGTHTICGIEVPYSRQAVYGLLKGQSKSPKLLALIVEKRPDLLGLPLVAESTKEAARAIGWKEVV